MRQYFMLTLVAVAIGVMPATVRGDISNGEAAQRICDQLIKSGQATPSDNIGVRYLNGTVWLEGRVRDQERSNRIAQAVWATDGVPVNQVIREKLVIDGNANSAIANIAVNNPLRTDANRAQPLPTSFRPRAAMQVQAVQAVPTPPPAPVPAAAPGAAPSNLPATEAAAGVPGAPLPMYASGTAAGGAAPIRYDRPSMPGYAWPSYAAYPNYAAVTYPKQYSPTAWPYIGPFYPYPQVPLGWRKVSLEWDDGWWWLDFKDKPRCCWWR